MKTIVDRWASIQETIEHSSKNKNVKVVAVSKKQPFAKVKEAYDVGVRHFGENYVQEALPKIQEGKNLNIVWHYIGALQTNKMNKIIPVVQFLHAIDQVSQIEKLEKMRELGIALPKILVQLNLANEDTKSGLLEKDIKSFFQHVSEKTNFEISGLMTFPPLQTDPEKNRGYFAKMHDWKEKINGCKLDRVHIQELSMGVSSDYWIAIEEGATFIRLGEAIFGPRD